jgi:hypothetical protein
MAKSTTYFVERTIETHRKVTRLCQKLILHRTHEKEQGLSSMLELVNLANLDDKAKPSRRLTYRL